MPRRPRIHVAGMPLHVVQRGHNREACFFTDEDYLAYREWLGEALKTTGCELHAYVQITNHVHLLFTPPSPNAVPQLLISLGRYYVQYINKTYRRTGTLWDSRYKSSLVQADTYLLQCQRYIKLNPVRASMVDDPVHFRWSSYRANGLGQFDPLLTPHPLYSALGRTDLERLTEPSIENRRAQFGHATCWPSFLMQAAAEHWVPLLISALRVVTHTALYSVRNSTRTPSTTSAWP
jgi:putative transposase